MMDNRTIFSLEGKQAVITGGASGLGFAMAKCMVASGAKVIILDICNDSNMQDACGELGEGRAVWYRCDVRDTVKIVPIADNIIADNGKIDILCNNAGNHCKKPIEEMTVDEFESVLDVHVVGAFALTKALVPHMKQNGSGSILFTASMTSFIGQPYVIGYSAAKSAYLGMVRTLASEISSFGVRVNAIVPGWIDTPMLRKAVDNDPERKQKILGRTPAASFGKADDIGWAAVFLCSDEANFINGVALPVDGGALIGF